MDLNGGNINLIGYVDEVSERRDPCCAFYKAPHSPIAGTRTVSMSNGEPRADVLSPEHLKALRAMDGFSKYALLRPLYPQEVRAAACGAWIRVLGQSKSIQLDEGGA